MNSIIIAQDSTITAQDSSHLGIQIGGNLSAISYNSTSKLGLNIGLYMNFSLCPNSKIQIEFWRIHKGSIWEWGDSRIDYNIAYLQLPVYYSFRLFQREEKVDLLNIQFGPFFSYVLTSKSDEGFEFSGRWRYKLEDIIKKFDYGLSLGLQYFPKKNWFIRLIYDHSLSTIFKTSKINPPVDASTAKMWSIILFIGYDFY